ncbi:hypothetical protein AHF37_11943 [Paragonimus kellicotti]|nr:hypothetical protein AHF37_11943 [Paragonimus kellicotti]
MLLCVAEALNRVYLRQAKPRKQNSNAFRIWPFGVGDQRTIQLKVPAGTRLTPHCTEVWSRPLCSRMKVIWNLSEQNKLGSNVSCQRRSLRSRGAPVIACFRTSNPIFVSEQVSKLRLAGFDSMS